MSDSLFCVCQLFRLLPFVFIFVISSPRRYEFSIWYQHVDPAPFFRCAFFFFFIISWTVFLLYLCAQLFVVFFFLMNNGIFHKTLQLLTYIQVRMLLILLAPRLNGTNDPSRRNETCSFIDDNVTELVRDNFMFDISVNVTGCCFLFCYINNFFFCKI